MPDYFESGLLVGQSAWHGMGTVIEEGDDRRFSVEDSLELSGLSEWSVELADIMFAYGEDNVGFVDDKRATVRVFNDGTVEPLGVVGTRYEPLQNRDAFEWFQPWLDTREVSIETAGSLKGGRCVWVLAQILRGDMDIGGGDLVRKFILLSTTHDGTGASRVGFTPVRVVCANTLGAAHRSNASQLLRVRHTKSQISSLEAIRETIDLVDQEFSATADQFRRLKRCDISRSDLQRYVKVVMELDEDAKLSKRQQTRFDAIYDLAISGVGQEASELTAWSAYNGVTEFLTHKVTDNAERRLLSGMEGSYAQMNKRALDLAVQLAS